MHHYRTAESLALWLFLLSIGGAALFCVGMIVCLAAMLILSGSIVWP